MTISKIKHRLKSNDYIPTWVQEPQDPILFKEYLRNYTQKIFDRAEKMMKIEDPYDVVQALYEQAQDELKNLKKIKSSKCKEQRKLFHIHLSERLKFVAKNFYSVLQLTEIKNKHN